MDVAWSCQFQFSKIDGNATQQGKKFFLSLDGGCFKLR